MRTYLLTALILFSIHSGPLGAQTALVPAPQKTAIPQDTPSTAPPVSHEFTATDVEAFLDGMIPLQLQQDDIAGVTILVQALLNMPRPGLSRFPLVRHRREPVAFQRGLLS